MRRATALCHGLACKPVVVGRADPTVRRVARAAKRFAKLSRRRPSRKGRKGSVVAGAVLPSITYDAPIRGAPPALEKVRMNWEHAYTAVLPRSAPRLFGI